MWFIVLINSPCWDSFLHLTLLSSKSDWPTALLHGTGLISLWKDYRESQQTDWLGNHTGKKKQPTKARLADFYLDPFTFVGYRNNRLNSHSIPYVLNVLQQCWWSYFKLGPPGDQHQFSPNDNRSIPKRINTIKVQGEMLWSFIKFSQLVL